jgi:exosortase
MAYERNPAETIALTATPRTVSLRWLLYGFWIAASLLVFLRPLGALIHLAAQNEADYIFLIPFISAGVICLERRTVFRSTSYELPGAALLTLASGAISASALLFHRSWSPSQSLSAYVLSLVLLWVAGFLLFFGKDATRAAEFSLVLLLLAVPLPDFMLHPVVYFLQRGSAEMVASLFDIAGISYLREGFIFEFGHLSIEIAEECSGIRSSMAILILALLAAHFYLRSFWRQALFLLSSLLIMIVKNGVRIATLTILALYVNPSFLFGRLHHQGGVVFFLLGLSLLVPILWILERSEASGSKNVTASRDEESLKNTMNRSSRRRSS